MHTKRMMRWTVYLYAMGWLAGCAMEQNFTRENTSATQLHQDFVQCDDNSKVQYPVRMEEIEPAHWSNPKTVCKTNHDTKETVCETKQPEMISATYDDVNKNARQDALVDCMTHTGYTQKLFPW